uniref:Uncharacterized protein orf76a n=1 Tax=Staurastrum punctulatum TaxID=102822 RepID=Q32RZ6_STAPU|nr:hypothetical protein StpuCp016 [Staurastrum punctulatum]AAX45781.1 hypothetical protein [Staurastrum punctulatum]
MLLYIDYLFPICLWLLFFFEKRKASRPEVCTLLRNEDEWGAQRFQRSSGQILIISYSDLILLPVLQGFCLLLFVIR